MICKGVVVAAGSYITEVRVTGEVYRFETSEMHELYCVTACEAQRVVMHNGHVVAGDWWVTGA